MCTPLICRGLARIVRYNEVLNVLATPAISEGRLLLPRRTWVMAVGSK